MRSLGCALIQNNWCPYEKGNLDTELDMHRGKMMCRHTGRMPSWRWGRDWSEGSTSQGTPGGLVRTTRGQKEFSLRAVGESMALLKPRLPKCERINCCCHSVCGICYSSPDKIEISENSETWLKDLCKPLPKFSRPRHPHPKNVEN